MLRSTGEAQACVEKLRAVYDFDEFVIVPFHQGDEPLPRKSSPTKISTLLLPERTPAQS